MNTQENMMLYGERKEADSLGSFTAWLFGFLLVISLPLTDVFLLPNVRSVSMAIVITLWIFLALSGENIRFTYAFVKSFTLLTAWLVIGLFYTRALFYGIEKTTMLFSYFVVLGFVIVNLSQNLNRIRLIYIGIFCGSLVTLVVALWFLGNPLELLQNISQFSRLKLGAANPILLARNFSLFVIVALWLIATFRNIYIFMFCSGTICLSLIYMLLSGSKGPVLSLVIGAMTITAIYTKYKIVTLSILTIVFLTIGVVAISYLPKDFVMQRFDVQGGDALDRVPVYLATIKMIYDSGPIEQLIGHGTGDFGYFLTHKDMVGYPHNIFLEIIYENGLIGFVFLITAIAIPIVESIKLSKMNIPKKDMFIVWAALAAYVSAVSNAQVTADLGSNVYIGLFGALLVGCCAYFKKMHEART